MKVNDTLNIELFTLTRTYARSTAWKWHIPLNEIPDLACEAYLAALRKLQRVKSYDNLSALIKVVAWRETLRTLKRRSSRKETVLATAVRLDDTRHEMSEGALGDAYAGADAIRRAAEHPSESTPDWRPAFHCACQNLSKRARMVLRALHRTDLPNAFPSVRKARQLCKLDRRQFNVGLWELQQKLIDVYAAYRF